MKITHTLLLLAARLDINAAPAKSNDHDLNAETIDAAKDTRGGSRFSCGQYKFEDGTVQEFYSQVWAGIPTDRMVCRHFKYEFRNKKGQDGTMVAAKVDLGCTCFFYEQSCDPNSGHAEKWEGWNGWQNYAFTDKKFKGWYCFEQA